MQETLPSSWYTDQHIFDLEREHIFMREWVCVGREEMIRLAGNHKVVEVHGESIIILRNSESELRAFYNVCRHRGAQLCADSVQENSNNRLPLKGGVLGGNRITCPYHAWTYDLDGQLLKAPHITEEMGLDTDDKNLHSVAIQSWGGFIFVNLSMTGDDNGVDSFSSHIKGSAELFHRYPLAKLRIAKTICYDVSANWKVLCENYNECYHCGPVHPELCKLVPAFKQAGGLELDWEQGVPHRDGAYTFTESGTSDRRPFPDLDENEQKNHKGDLVYPNLFLSMAAEHVAVFVLHPLCPDQTRIDCHFLFEPYEMEKSSFDPSDVIDFWHLVNRQDWSVCERVQKGVSSRIHSKGVFSPMEDWNLDIRKYVSDRISTYVEK